MYSDEDIDGAVGAGAFPAEAAEALRAYVAGARGTGNAVDEEQFRLLTGFNDIFVTIACALVIFAAAMLGAQAGHAVWGGLFVAAACWPMAEMFTRRRRMALPSIVLLLGWVIGLGFVGYGIGEWLMPTHAEIPQLGGAPYTYLLHYPWQEALIAGMAGLAAGLGALLHWWRFRVAITIAAAVGAGVLLLLAAVAAVTNSELASNTIIPPAALVCGLGVFAYAMHWDLSDPERRSQRADIAFWLHLLAAPLIAHPLFHWMGVTSGAELSAATVAGVLAIYLLFAGVALAVDRRALLVSALAYVLIALTQLFRDYGAVGTNVALTALIIGSALLALSAFWGVIRARLLGLLPAEITARLPRAAVPVSG